MEISYVELQPTLAQCLLELNLTLRRRLAGTQLPRLNLRACDYDLRAEKERLTSIFLSEISAIRSCCCRPSVRPE